MRFPRLCVLSILAAVSAFPQSSTVSSTPPDGYRVYTEHPRLFLRPQRLRLLKRESERKSIRWEQFQTLILGKARMPEPGFAYGLYYRVSGDETMGRQALNWALGPGSDLRQLSLVFDWCQDLLTEAQFKTLAGKLERGIQATQKDSSIPAIRSRVLAAIALSDHVPQITERLLESTVAGWWDKQAAPALKAGKLNVPRDDGYALYELLHAVRDNTNIEMRDAAPVFFKGFPIFHLMSHYPATYPGPENDYRIPAAMGASEPDLNHAALSRAAELSMVAYDANAPETQVLQGWLMHDHFLLRGTYGIPYEFLWANPYQPGLSYFHVPLVFHDDLFGRLLVRSTWDEDATWLGYFDGEVQLFKDGKVTILNPQLTRGPLSLTEAIVFFGDNVRRFRVLLKEDEEVFVLGLKPNQAYDVEVDGEEMVELKTDAGGILSLNLPRKIEIGVRMKEARALPVTP